MPELLLELYSEEIPHKLQVHARKQLKESIEAYLSEEGIDYKSITAYSCPTRLSVLIKEIPTNIRIPVKEIRGPKVGVLQNILDNFIRAHNVSKKDIFEKEIEKGKFYFVKTKQKKL